VEVSVTKLILREPVTLPVEAENIRPDRFAGLSQQEVAALPLLFGRRQKTIGDLFVVEGDGAEDILIEGDLRHVKRIGERMGAGQITIKGDAGMHLGAHMHGGEIAVYGNVQAWAGAHISGGTIQVFGDAGPMLGAAYTGETRGMQGGIIVVQGNAGPRVGERMRRGLIAIQGKVGEFAGARMIAGSIFAFGRLGARAGAGMKRGTIVALGGLEDDLLPVFRYACSYNPTFLRYYLLQLREKGLLVTHEQIDGIFDRYTGDITSLGKGEILVHDQHQ
jgi:formylmethanofuran dehydrogenase subunit C